MEKQEIKFGFVIVANNFFINLIVNSVKMSSIVLDKDDDRDSERIKAFKVIYERAMQGKPIIFENNDN